MPYNSLTYRGHRTDNTDGTSYTFSACDIGTASAKRAVHVIAYIDGDNSTSFTTTLTIGGVSATSVVTTSYPLYGNRVQMFVARITSGTTADIVLTTGSTARRVAIAWYTFNPLSLTTIDIAGQAANASTVTAADLDVVDGGIAFVAGHSTGPSMDSSWNGVDSRVVDLASTQLEATSSYIAAFTVKTTETSSVRDATYGSGFATRIITSVSYGAEWGEILETVTDGIGVADSAPVDNVYVVALTDGAGVSDTALTRLPIIYDETLTETVATDTDLTVIRAFSESLVEGLGFTVAPDYKFGMSASDGINVRAVPTLNSVIRLTDGIGVADTTAYLFRLGPTLAEQIGLQDQPATQAKLALVVTEASRLQHALVTSIPRTISETVGIASALVAVRAVTVIERLGLADSLTPRLTMQLTQTERVRLTDTLRRFFGGDVLEGIGVTETMLGSRRFRPTLTDGVGAADALGAKLVLRLVATDRVNLDDADALKMIFSPVATDGVELSAAYISPDNSVTTWAINTRNGAVTEYSNFVFNSFAKLDGKYFGASSAGLYELVGDTDAGTDIVAQIKSGFAQFGGSRFTSFKAAYLGMRGEGDFVLKVETGDGKTYTYAVVGKDMQTTKVHMGKGLRARYFAFELISTGQDFDLDDIEFMPLVAQRRV